MLTQDVVVKLILQHIGGAKLKPSTLMDIEGLPSMVRTAPLASLVTSLSQYGSTGQEIRDNLLKNPRAESANKILSAIPRFEAAVNASTLTNAQKDIVKAAADEFEQSVTDFLRHTNILSGKEIGDPLAEQSQAFIDEITAIAANAANGSAAAANAWAAANAAWANAQAAFANAQSALDYALLATGAANLAGDYAVAAQNWAYSANSSASAANGFSFLAAGHASSANTSAFQANLAAVSANSSAASANSSAVLSANYAGQANSAAIVAQQYAADANSSAANAYASTIITAGHVASANGSAIAAAANAVAAEGFAVSANNSAANAASQVTLAANFATNANNSAAAAAANAISAESSATSANTSAASANASSVLAAGYATNANNSAAAAAANAVLAQGYATSANSSAASANASSTLSASYSETAAAQATIATTQATIATASAAAAQTSAVLAASLSRGYINPNANFMDWPTGGTNVAPASGWQHWSYAGGTYQRISITAIGYPADRKPEGSDYALQGVVPASSYSVGLMTNPDLIPVSPGRYTVETTTHLLDGNYQGAGVLVYYFNAASEYLGGDYLMFWADPDISGTVGSGIWGIRRWSKNFTTPANTAYVRLYAMANYLGFPTGVTAAKNLVFYKVGIKAGDATDATVETHSSAIATLDSRTASYWLKVSADAGTATLAMQATDSGGVPATSITMLADVVRLGNSTSSTPSLAISNGVAQFTGELNVGTGSGARVNITKDLIRVYDANNVMRVRLGVW